MRIRRLYLCPLICLILLSGCSLPWVSGGFANDPAAQRQYLDSLSRAVHQPAMTVHIKLAWIGEGDLGYHGPMSVTDRLRLSGRRIAVDEWRNVSIPVFPFHLVLAGRRFCISVMPRQWVCSPTYRYSLAWYVEQYLLGGWVQDLRFSLQRGRDVTTLKFAGQGQLGCTPAGAGAGTAKGYSWCAFRDLSAAQRQRAVSGTVEIDTHTGLPLRLTARGRQQDGRYPDTETVSFTYGGAGRVALPTRYTRTPCLSWIPAIHCIELTKKRKAVP